MISNLLPCNQFHLLLVLLAHALYELIQRVSASRRTNLEFRTTWRLRWRFGGATNLAGASLLSDVFLQDYSIQIFRSEDLGGANDVLSLCCLLLSTTVANQVAEVLEGEDLVCSIICACQTSLNVIRFCSELEVVPRQIKTFSALGTLQLICTIRINSLNLLISINFPTSDLVACGRIR